MKYIPTQIKRMLMNAKFYLRNNSFIVHIHMVMSPVKSAELPIILLLLKNYIQLKG